MTAFFLLQMLVCLFTVVRIDGFHFGELASGVADQRGVESGVGLSPDRINEPMSVVAGGRSTAGETFCLRAARRRGCP
jgi:hypothetical protein